MQSQYSWLRNTRSKDRIIWKFANSHTPKENNRGCRLLSIQSGSFKADSFLDRLKVAIRQEIDTREKSHISSLEDSTSVATDEEVFVPTAGALLTNAQEKQRFLNGKPKVSRPCTYCTETHRPEKCDKITSVEER